MLTANKLYSISIVIPTFNSEKYLDNCLYSIFQQDYPKELIEILVIDGGSTDSTIEIAKKYTVKIFSNPLKTGEAGKAIGLKNAKNELISLIDSDNILPDINWLKKMTQPFKDDFRIIGTEPIEFSYKKDMSIINRYCALIGMNDPICLFLGNYDRFCYLSGKWTNIKLETKDFPDYILIELKKNNIKRIPTIGANGTIYRRNFFEGIKINDYLFDIDLLKEKILNSENPIFFSKVKTGIIHLYCDNFKNLFNKQKRRIRDYKKYGNLRKTNWININKYGLVKFLFYVITFFPLIFQSLKGFIRKRDFAWFIHPIVCIITTIVYLRFWFIKKI